jgi:uncharacterized membrane protein
LVKNLFRYHPRLWVSGITASAFYFLLPQSLSFLTRVLVCWNGGVVVFLVLIFMWMKRQTAAHLRTRYAEEDESAAFILIAVTIAALLSLAAVLEPLATVKRVTGAVRGAHFALAALTLINSWLLVPTMFTTHYADQFYSAKEGDRPLHFPNTPLPVFWDFAYFSFTIAAACQTADVSTLHAGVRKLVIAHTLISFLFNASILGFAINVTAGLVGGN